MNEFYKNLKAIREEQGISLDEIHERTKINKSVLSLIEDGKFEDLNRTYLRLFLRAYCNEIGVNRKNRKNRILGILMRRPFLYYLKSVFFKNVLDKI